MAKTTRGKGRGRGRSNGKPSARIYTETLKNPRFVASAVEARGLEAWQRQLTAHVAAQQPQLFKLPNADVRALNAKIRDAVSKVTGIRIQGSVLPRAKDFLAKVASEIDWVIRDQKDLPPIAFDPPVPPNGEFWWASTDYWWPGGIEAQYQTDGLHFYGGIGYDGDPLIHRSAGAVAHFVLDSARRPPSTNGKWRSVAGIEVFGTIVGCTGVYQWLLFADDKWCKCWVELRQTAFQIVGGSRVVLASAADRRMPINEENTTRVVTATLPGFVPVTIEFGLVDPAASVFADIEVRFDIQLEGESGIKFSPEQNPMNSVVVRTPQWKVQPI